MMRVLVRVGLALALVLAPALCCCNARWLSTAAAGEVVSTARPAPTPAEPAKPSCCHAAANSCCEAETSRRPQPTQPASPSPSCCCSADRPDAARLGAAATVPKPEPSGEWLPFPVFPAAVDLPEHAGFPPGADPPERAGVDARFAALFERHVLRC